MNPNDYFNLAIRTLASRSAYGTQGKMADFFDIPRKRFNNYLGGRTELSIEIKDLMAKRLGCNFEDIIMLGRRLADGVEPENIFPYVITVKPFPGAYAPPPLDEDSPRRQPNGLPALTGHVSETGEEYVHIPLASVELGAGSGIIIDVEEFKERFAFRLDWLSGAASSAKNCVLMYVHGDSMAPAIEHKDIVLVDQGKTRPRPGRIFAISSGEGVAQVKRLDVAGGRVVIRSDNPAYPPYEVDPETTWFKILGQVIWLGREIN